MPLFLMSLLPGKSTLDSLKWAAIAVLVLGGSTLALVLFTHTPSKLTYAVSAEHEKGNVEKLKAALEAEKAEKAAFADALESRKRQDKARDDKTAELSAALIILKAENAELTKPRPDDGSMPLDPLDPWLLRNSKAGSANRNRP